MGCWDPASVLLIHEVWSRNWTLVFLIPGRWCWGYWFGNHILWTTASGRDFFMLVDWIMMKPVFFLLPLFILSYITSRFFGKSVCFICHSNETFLFHSPGISLRPRLTVIHLTWLRDRRMILVSHIDFFSCLDFIFFLRCSYLSMFSIMVTANLWLLSRCPLHCHRLSQIWKLGAFPPPAAHRPNPYLLANLFILHRWLESSSWVTLKNSEKKKQFGNGFFSWLFSTVCIFP